jgi:hypothetical protein
VPGRKSVTISDRSYDHLKTLARNKEMSATELAEFLVDQYSRPYVRAFIDETARGAPWQKTYEDIVLDPKIKSYQSTVWVRTKDYVDNVGPPYWTIDKRIRDPDDLFSHEKIFIISRNSWDKKEVWDWIGYWLIYCSLREEKFRLFIIKEKDADPIATDKDTARILSQYYDMGIYKEAPDKGGSEDMVGFLQIDEKSRPSARPPYVRFSSRVNAAIIRDAEKYFGCFKKCAQTMKTIEDFVRLRNQQYDE